MSRKVLANAARRLETAGVWASLMVHISSNELTPEDFKTALAGRGALWRNYGFCRNQKAERLLIRMPGPMELVDDWRYGEDTAHTLRCLCAEFGGVPGALILFHRNGRSLTKQE